MKKGLFFYEYAPEELEKIITKQKRAIEHMKKKNAKNTYSILIITDDFADSVAFSRHSNLLHSLYTRGRHSMISCVTATQTFNAVHPIIRVNATQLYVYRLRNNTDIETVIEDISASVDRKTLIQIDTQCTEEPFGVLYVKLTATN